MLIKFEDAFTILANLHINLLQYMIIYVASRWKLKCRRLEREVDRYTHSTQQMSERNEQLIRDMENTKTQMNLNTQHVDHARQELSDAAVRKT